MTTIPPPSKPLPIQSILTNETKKMNDEIKNLDKLIEESVIKNNSSLISEPLKTFKSSFNRMKDNENKRVIITSSAFIKLEPNTSASVLIDFKHTFQYIPYINYNVLCNDDHFELVHYIKDITQKNMTINIENQSDTAREISINYKIM